MLITGAVWVIGSSWTLKLRHKMGLRKRGTGQSRVQDKRSGESRVQDKRSGVFTVNILFTNQISMFEAKISDHSLSYLISYKKKLSSSVQQPFLFLFVLFFIFPPMCFRSSLFKWADMSHPKKFSHSDWLRILPEDLSENFARNLKKLSSS